MKPTHPPLGPVEPAPGLFRRPASPLFLNAAPRLRALLWAAALAALAPAAVQAADPRVFHLSPAGNDQWSGRLAAPNAARTDGPLATAGRARDAVRELKRSQGGALRQPVVVRSAPGLYSLFEPVVFTPEDSGGPGAPVVYEAAPGTAVWSGGRRVTGWKPAQTGNPALWVAEIPAVRDGSWYFRQLWVNGQRRARSRHPNQGCFAVAELPGVTAKMEWTQGQTSFGFKAGDIQAWPSIRQAEVRVMNRWVESHLPVAAVDETNRIIRFTKKSVFKLDKGDLWYLENAMEALDQPGEWFLDGPAGRLYYLPMPGEDIQRAEVIAPVLAQVVRFDGKPEAGQYVENIEFRGLSFSHTEWYFPSGFDRGNDKAQIWPPPNPEVGGFGQAAIGVPGSVRGTGARACVFEECAFTRLGTYGLELARGCQSNRVSRCEFSDLGAGGIKLGETAIRTKAAELARDNEVAGCQIRDGGKVWHSAIGVWIGQSPNNRLTHCEISDFYYTAVSIGWTWGYGPALATNCLVEWNHIHDIGRKSTGEGPILSDMGGLYTLGLHTGTIVRNNLWHDINGLHYGGWGIYFDEGTTGILAQNNLVYRTTHGGFHQHYGKNNTVRNNIFAFARDWAVQRTRAEAHLSFTFERNLVLWDKGVPLGGNWSGGPAGFTMRSNLYWFEGAKAPQFAGKSFADWQAAGQDAGSRLANPAFKNPRAGDFSLPAGSPALETGFKPFDLSAAGAGR